MTQSKPTTLSLVGQFLEQLHIPGSYIELRPCSDRERGVDVPSRRWFQSPQEFEDDAYSIVDYCKRKSLGCYFGVLPRPENKVGTDASITLGRAVWADIDDKETADGNSHGSWPARRSRRRRLSSLAAAVYISTIS